MRLVIGWQSFSEGIAQQVNYKATLLLLRLLLNVEVAYLLLLNNISSIISVKCPMVRDSLFHLLHENYCFMACVILWSKFILKNTKYNDDCFPDDARHLFFNDKGCFYFFYSKALTFFFGIFGLAVMVTFVFRTSRNSCNTTWYHVIQWLVYIIYRFFLILFHVTEDPNMERIYHNIWYACVECSITDHLNKCL